ncbi:CYTH domain-containing protein [Planococcus beigongshangi]|uniref:CYTH domain-containing protein n=1 Tax=Planococcus beigongshangi TaxID=2782536 RepID=UPI00193B1AB0|nr:CYTH domain-containing protein [Planococcus beigongshangi]
MSKELEIEFKNLLTKEEYHRLSAFFGYTADDAKEQINYYFDTADFLLRQQKSALRIRKKKDGFECTLKTPAETGYYEITDQLTRKQAEELIELRSFEAPEVAAALKEMGILSRQLELLGNLTTHRIEFPYENGLLVFDHSEYLDMEDFEMEYEVTDYAEGKKKFTSLLQDHGIPVRPTDKKIARFMTAATEQPAKKIIE